MQYRLEILARARRDLQDAPERLRAAMVDVLRERQVEPYPAYAEPLRAPSADVLKIKVDGWRVFCRVDDTCEVIRVTNIKRRDRNTYTALYSLLC